MEVVGPVGPWLSIVIGGAACLLSSECCRVPSGVEDYSSNIAILDFMDGGLCRVMHSDG